MKNGQGIFLGIRNTKTQKDMVQLKCRNNGPRITPGIIAFPLAKSFIKEGRLQSSAGSLFLCLKFLCIKKEQQFCPFNNPIYLQFLDSELALLP